MLNDELPHIIFQSYTLSRLNPSGWDIFVRKLIMNVTLPLVWESVVKYIEPEVTISPVL